MSVIAALLPEPVASAEAFDDSAPCELFPDEERAIAKAVEKRRREFTTVRGCARRALAALGYPPVPIVPGPRGGPVWPEGVVGSMTHCAGYRAAVVAHAWDIATLGVDAEPNEPLPSGVLDVVALDEERRWVAAYLRDHPAVRWDRLLFSVKEAVYKAWFPLTRRWLDFDQAAVTVDPRHGAFHARLLVDGPVLADDSRLDRFTGRWAAGRDLLVTAIAVPAAPGVVEAGAAVDAVPGDRPPAGGRHRSGRPVLET
ncbi:4'-phosphopantetheinyl transferase family protein [Planosporangium sp. 12N6]|uniref:4'-phosphopantetheinyl transferase family protein n=1 Tax=Planosporangium spinosum TaxID=3402278 RepID=UPI003CF1DF80